VSEGLQNASNTLSTATEDMLCFFHNQKSAPISSIHENRQYCNMFLAAFPQEDGSTTAWVWGRATKSLSYNTCILLLLSILPSLTPNSTTISFNQNQDELKKGAMFWRFVENHTCEGAMIAWEKRGDQKPKSPH
jgi:hypothetical protein